MADGLGHAVAGGRRRPGLGRRQRPLALGHRDRPRQRRGPHLSRRGRRQPQRGGQLHHRAAAGKRLRFVVFGDNRTGGDVHRQLVEGLVTEAPDFVVNTGDMVGESTVDEWQTFFSIEYPLLRQTPLYPVMGNHEHDYGEDDMYAQLFPLGDRARFSGRVYSFDYGSAHVAILDSNGDLGAQSRWLEADLSAADARGQRSFIALHFGPVCGCSGIGHGSNDDADPVLDVATRHRVGAIFSGHNHLYERGVSRGVPYVVTGGGGAPLQGRAPSPRPRPPSRKIITWSSISSATSCSSAPRPPRASCSTAPLAAR